MAVNVTGSGRQGPVSVYQLASDLQHVSVLIKSALCTVLCCRLLFKTPGGGSSNGGNGVPTAPRGG